MLGLPSDGERFAATHPPFVKEFRIMARTLLVTGASGQLGRLVLEDLLARPSEDTIIALTRSPERLRAAFPSAKRLEIREADFDREDGLAAAFFGANRVLLISTDALDRPGRRLEQHKRAIEAAAAAGVTHLVYTSVTNPVADSPLPLADDHRRTEEALAASSLGHTILRVGWWLDNYLGALPSAFESGALVAAASTGKANFINREDTARAAPAALAAAFEGRRTLNIVGPTPIDHRALAAAASAAFGKPLAYVAVAGGDKQKALEAFLPPPVAALLVGFDLAVARGDFDVSSSDFRELTGREPLSAESFFAKSTG